MNLVRARSVRTPLSLTALALALPVLSVAHPPEASAGPAASGEFRVNTTSSGNQVEPSIARDADGDYVVAWAAGSGQDGSTYGVYAQRYDASGAPRGTETLVNTTTADEQRDPSVAMDADGDYVIAWTSNLQDGAFLGVYAQRYDADGNPQGAETRVNTTTAGQQTEPSVAMDASGDYVVTWASSAQDGSGYGVYAQRYSAAGTPRGSETLVNTTVLDDQRDPHVAMDATGDYVIIWQSDAQDGGGYGIYAQRYNAGGTARGVETRVNTTTAGHQDFGAVAMDASGDYVVTWSSELDDDGDGAYSQRFNAVGVPQGNETRVNTTTVDDQYGVSAAMDAGGDYVITWQSHAQDGDGWGVYAQRYSSTGTKQGAETAVNVATSSFQDSPEVAMDADGDFVVTWESSFQDGSGEGVFGRRFRGPQDVDLALTQSDDVDQAAVDGRVSYRIRVANLNEPVEDTGISSIDAAIGAASGVYVVSTIPEGATFSSSTGTGWTCTPAATTVRCRLAAPLGAGDWSTVLSVTYTMPSSAGVLLHPARAYQAQLDAVAANNVEVERTSVHCTIEFAHPSYSKSEFSPATATVTRHGTGCGTSSVQYDSTPGTADLGADYTDVAGTLTWGDGDTDKTFIVPLIDDPLDETTERLKLDLGNPTGALLGGTSLVTVYVGDNDAAPRVNFTTATTPASETTGLVELIIRLSAVSGRDVTVDLARSGTAIHGNDYFAETRLVIPAGQRTATFDVEIVDDALTEGAESAILSLTNPNGATPGSIASHQITIGPSD